MKNNNHKWTLKSYLIILVISFIISVLLYLFVILPIATYCPPGAECAFVDVRKVIFFFFVFWFLVFITISAIYIILKLIKDRINWKR
jgi:hypothetical protein